MRILALGPVTGIAAIALAVTLGGCASSGTPSAAPTVAATHSAAPKATGGCKLKTTFDYIVRDSDPGASVMASEIGNADLANCTTALSGFAATAGQASGECTTIALASSNPGYNVNAVPAAPLKDVIQSAGPGC